MVAPYANITELDEELVHTLIEKIIVHEKEIIDGETVMRIEIYYRFIGKTSDCLSRSVTPIKTKQNPSLQRILLLDQCGALKGKAPGRFPPSAPSITTQFYIG